MQPARNAKSSSSQIGSSVLFAEWRKYLNWKQSCTSAGANDDQQAYLNESLAFKYRSFVCITSNEENASLMPCLIMSNYWDFFLHTTELGKWAEERKGTFQFWLPAPSDCMDTMS